MTTRFFPFALQTVPSFFNGEPFPVPFIETNNSHPFSAERLILPGFVADYLIVTKICLGDDENILPGEVHGSLFAPQMQGIVLPPKVIASGAKVEIMILNRSGSQMTVSPVIVGYDLVERGTYQRNPAPPVIPPPLDVYPHG